MKLTQPSPPQQSSTYGGDKKKKGFCDIEKGQDWMSNYYRRKQYHKEGCGLTCECISEETGKPGLKKQKEEGDKPKDPEVKCVNTAYSKAVSVDVSLMRMLANKFCSGDKNKKRSQDLTAKDVSSSAYKYYKFHFELDPGKNSKFDCNAVFKSITGKCQGYDSHSIQSQGGAKIDDCGASFSYKITVPDKPKPKPDTVTQHGLQPRKCHTKDQFGSHGDVRGGELSMPRLDVLGSPMTRPN
ncbi:hypothetical protein PENSUB_10667 [Penicillium subrubescens]|uniref:Uncharacterized protein n=1 Tax=Penicillium subrubescens TaxID=1316194 RepID=A0A1Q5T8D5_9EURO|nr:hypothetical protein PENSUB_10667 [Penicillium subrubescens]